MEKSEHIGANRTGVGTSPIQAREMQSGMDEYAISSGGGNRMESMRQVELEQASRLGSVPLPDTAKGMLKSMMERFTGHQPAIFVNKLGERLAYERTGVRIYEAMMLKCEVANAQGIEKVQVPVDRLKQFHDEEGKHFRMLVETMEQLGVDPTAQTPDADVSGVAGSGIMKVITDPRTTVPQSLEAMLSLELTDNAAWEVLITLARDMGQEDMAKRFEEALAEEQIHVEEIRSWYEKSIREEAAVSRTTH